MSKKHFTKKIIFLIFFLIIGFELSFDTYASNETNLNISIQEGTLSVDIVDSNGNSVPNPLIVMNSQIAKFDILDSAGVFGTEEERIRLSNPTSTTAWTTTIAATDGPTAMWIGTGSITHTFDYNSPMYSSGTLTIDPSRALIIPVHKDSTDGISAGSLTRFAEGTIDSITLFSSTTAPTFEEYDFWNADVMQQIPPAQAADTYIINMTLTAI